MSPALVLSAPATRASLRPAKQTLISRRTCLPATRVRSHLWRSSPSNRYALGGETERGASQGSPLFFTYGGPSVAAGCLRRGGDSDLLNVPSPTRIAAGSISRKFASQ